MSQIGTMVPASALLRLLPQNTTPLAAIPARQGRSMVIPVCCVTANPPHLNQAAVYCLVKQPYGNLIFRGKCFFFRNMAFFVKQRKIFPEPLLWKIKFIIHKAVPVVPGKSKEYAGLTVFCFAQTAAVLVLHFGGMFPFFTKHVSSTDSIPGICSTCLESSPW